MNRITILLPITILITSLLYSCSEVIFRDVNCRDFENNNDLKWFSGKKGEILTFNKSDGTTVSFNIVDKYIFHRTKYISDTGCGCHDMWGMMMTNENDTISMYSQAKYVEDNDANLYDNLYIKIDGELSGFITEDKLLVPEFSIDTLNFNNIIKFSFNHNGNKKFNTIYIAPEIGIIQMNRNDGEIWINQNLTEIQSTSFDSFEYSENTCE